MRLVSFGDPGGERPGFVVGDEIMDVGVLRPQWPGSWRRILAAGLGSELPALLAEATGRNDAPASRAVGGGAGISVRRVGGTSTGSGEADEPRRKAVPLGSVRLGPPIPDPSKIVAIGLNYRDHAEEQNKQPPEVPLLFSKAPSCLVGPNDPIVLPDPSVENRVDAEAELCVVIGKKARNVDPGDAFGHILGYTVLNDVSGRGAQYGDRQWFRGKSFDTFAPCGPWIVTGDELADPSGLALEAWWGEEQMQAGNTENLIHDVPALIAYVSRQMTLEPGDLLATGTPSGVGVFRDPPVFLQRGMTVRIRLQGVGELINVVL